MKLSVLIVNYNVRAYLEQCLRTVFTALERLEGEVFVVDNLSTDGSVEMVRAVVDGQLVLLSVELETTSGRAIRHPTDRAAQIAGIATKVLPEIIEP